MLGPIEAIIFDLDGTLIDTETLAALAIQQVVEPYGKRVEWDLQKRLLGLRGPEWSNLLVEELKLGNTITPDSIVLQWERKLHQMIDEVEIMPGVNDLITLCVQRSIKMAIATSSNSDSARMKILRHPIIRDNISVVVCGDDPAVKLGKPSPDIYLVAGTS